MKIPKPNSSLVVVQAYTFILIFTHSHYSEPTTSPNNPTQAPTRIFFPVSMLFLLELAHLSHYNQQELGMHLATH